MQCCVEPLGKIAQGFYLRDVVPRVLRQHWTEFFLPMLSGASRAKLCRVFTCAMLSQNIKTTLNRIFPAHCCYEPQRQYWTRFCPCAGFSRVSETTLHKVLTVQWRVKSIKRTLHRIFSCPMLPGASPTTSHNPFNVQCCHTSIKTRSYRNFL